MDVLVLDDTPAFRAGLVEDLQRAGHSVLEYPGTDFSPGPVLAWLEQQIDRSRPLAALVDRWLEDGQEEEIDGFEVMETLIRQGHRFQPLVFMTSTASEFVAADVREHAANRFQAEVVSKQDVVDWAQVL